MKNDTKINGIHGLLFISMDYCTKAETRANIVHHFAEPSVNGLFKFLFESNGMDLHAATQIFFLLCFRFFLLV